MVIHVCIHMAYGACPPRAPPTAARATMYDVSVESLFGSMIQDLGDTVQKR